MNLNKIAAINIITFGFPLVTILILAIVGFREIHLVIKDLGAVGVLLFLSAALLQGFVIGIGWLVFVALPLSFVLKKRIVSRANIILFSLVITIAWGALFYSVVTYGIKDLLVNELEMSIELAVVVVILGLGGGYGLSRGAGHLTSQ
ncbi:hypothetical protein [Leucothrix arctica]|uniref:Uncharacterized protein n=1 Tax=Leucothrix arctica TaxID=1481894 RepID=A0A317CMU5_9GAMM|nr:hypothetical protein [Leucothrix arctica]PWQ99868.1 hypothetical protein DKT75_00015 [Leucothrix arctica]